MDATADTVKECWAFYETELGRPPTAIELWAWLYSPPWRCAPVFDPSEWMLPLE